MGVSNLLQFLRPMQKRVAIKNYQGSVVAVDAMCWIHRGMISSAVSNVTGESNDNYLKFIISILSVLLEHNITPIMVFDGYEMPPKERENQDRRVRREKAREEALAMIQKNRGSINTEIMRKCMQAISITPEVVARVMGICREMNVRVLMAPYEADAQVAYLCRSGIAHCAISEDSDLLAYGCPRVWYKLERDGKADEMSLGFSSDPDVKCTKGMLKGLSHRMFVTMCVLSGSDYDDGCHINGMGIKLAHRFVLQFGTLPAVMAALEENACWAKKLPAHVSVKELESHYLNVSQIFLHNVVYDPSTDHLTHVTPLGGDETHMDIIVDICQRLRGKAVNFRVVSEGRINPRTGEPLVYAVTDKDREMLEGIRFPDIASLPVYASDAGTTTDALLQGPFPPSPQVHRAGSQGDSLDDAALQCSAAMPTIAVPSSTSACTDQTIDPLQSDESHSSISTSDEWEDATKSQKCKLRALIDSSERVVSARTKRTRASYSTT
ncbi:exonuclease I, putative [Babesia caballi]|uniref:Exonuclease 1 n=1 Tax=Babesia caballi TaxID=5871 RepID=A0AAV4LWE0_BABCB|nr:exonuclease I, putative [Babesia caballi]